MKKRNKRLVEFTDNQLTCEMAARRELAKVDIVGENKKLIERLKKETHKLMSGETLMIPFRDLILKILFSWEDDDYCSMIIENIKPKKKSAASKLVADALEYQLSDSGCYDLAKAVPAVGRAVKAFEKKIKALIAECDALDKKYGCGGSFFDDFIY